LRNQFRFFNF